MDRSTNSRSVRLAVITAGLLLLAACADDDDESTSSSAPTPSTPATTTIAVTVPTTTDAPVATASTETDAPTTAASTTAARTTIAPTTDAPTTDAPTTVAPTTVAPTTTFAPDGFDSLGLPPVEVTVAGDDSTRPLFSWQPPAGAVSYQLVVQTADGVPLWAWTGDETQVVLGGEARPANVEGPTLTGPSRIRVWAFDAAKALVAVSAWTPVGPA